MSDSALRLLAPAIGGILFAIFGPSSVVAIGSADADVLGLMTSATGVGTLVMGLLLGRLRLGPRLVLTATLGQVLYGIALLITFAMRDILTVVALSALVGFAMASAVGFGTLVQARTDDRYRGRVLGANGTTRALLMVLGEAGGSFVVGQVGLLPVLDTACVILILGGLLGIVLLSRVTVPRSVTVEA